MKELADAGGLEYPRLESLSEDMSLPHIRYQFNRLKPDETYERASIRVNGACSDGIGQLGVEEADIGGTGRIQFTRQLGSKLVFLLMMLIVVCEFRVLTI